MPSRIRFQPEDAICLLEATPEVLRSQLQHLDGAWIRNNYGADTFSPYDVVRHLIHGERVDWIPRLRILIEHGESRPFDPYIIEELCEESDDQSIVQLLDKLALLRHENLEALRGMNLIDEQWKLRGTHPAIGTVTASELVATWAVHDLNHIHQIAKCLGNQYRDAIGPWRKNLTFIDRRLLRRCSHRLRDLCASHLNTVCRIGTPIHVRHCLANNDHVIRLVRGRGILPRLQSRRFERSGPRFESGFPTSWLPSSNGDI